MNKRLNIQRDTTNLPVWRNCWKVLVLIAAVLLVFADAAAAERDQYWNIKVGLAATYDNNILRYSDKYLERFVNRQDEGRFHINSRDDLQLLSWIRLSRSFRAFGGLNSIVSADVRRRTYTHNSIKSWSYLNLGWRQDLARKWSMYASYNIIPEFYVRHYRDEDWVRTLGATPESFRPFAFAKDNFGFWLQHDVLQKTRLRLSYSYMRYFHNTHYTEYDSRNHQYGLQAFHSLHKNVDISIGYKYMTSKAKGVDDILESIQNSDDADASYKEDEFALSVEVRLPRLLGMKNAVTLEGDYARRSFTTAHTPVDDPLHSGRSDHEYDLSVAYTAEVSDGWTLGVQYGWRMRDSRTVSATNARFVSDEKDYHQYTIGMEMTYAIRF